MRHSTPGAALFSILAIAGIIASCGNPTVPQQHSPTSDSVVLVTNDQAAVMHAYVERLRLGLGSPFRLVEAALRDERLGSARSTVAARLLHDIENGRMYEVSPLVLVDACADSTSALVQLELMRDAIERAADPRVGELAIDLTYQRLERDSIISDRLADAAYRVAALLRDRALAKADVKRILSQRREGAKALDLVIAWRVQRRFAVEQPTLQPVDTRVREQAERLALLLRGGVEAALVPVRSELARALPEVRPALSMEDAARLLEIAGRERRPPQNALVITLRWLARGAAGTRNRASSEPWQQLLHQPLDEEAFVAGLRNTTRDSADEPVAARVALAAAIAMRPFAQEPLAHADTFTRARLQEDFGVHVHTDRTLPLSWRQATLDDLGNALGDLRAVLPGLDLAGLAFDVRAIDGNARYQAYHDPRNRVIRIDPSAAAGTLAHEIGHDVDWQLARRKYNTSSSYATDYAVRKRKALAYFVAAIDTDERPAEAFARRFEWYVAAALAAQGRSNGFLSSVQSDWIAGYGSAVRPDATLYARSSFATLLAQGASLDSDQRMAAELLIHSSTEVCSADTLQAGPRARGQVVFDLLSARRRLEVPQCTGLPWVTW